jgi:hypothetical protein
MKPQVFFSFHYEKDLWRVRHIRRLLWDWDGTAWETMKRTTETSMRYWIDRQLRGTAVTAVLIGQETAKRFFVHYEIKRSRESGKRLLGIYIHNVKDQNGETCPRGANPFDQHIVIEGGREIQLSERVLTFDWVNDNGEANFGRWVEAASRDNRNAA